MEHFLSQTWELRFFWLSFVAYSFAFLLYVAFLAVERKKIGSIATFFMTMAFLFQTVALILRSVHVGRIPLTNMFEYISIFAWFSAIFYFIMLKMYKLQILGAFTTAIIFMLMVASSLLPKDVSMQLVPALQSYWLTIHVTLAAFGEAAFTAAFAANIMFFLKSWIHSESSLAKRLPELNTLDQVSYKAIKAGYPLFTVGALFAGAIWAEQAWGSFWSWDPKEVGSLVVWLLYSAYLHARIVKGWSGMRAAVLGSLGFICTLLTFFANMFLGGLHAYN